MILFSIIIPVYNTNIDILKKCLDSLLRQKNVDNNYEIIIMNDGTSKKDTNLFLKNLNNKKIKIVNSKINSGTAWAREKAFLHSSGYYICFVDSDDIVDKYYLNKINNAIKQNNPDVVFLDISGKSHKNNKVITDKDIFKKNRIYWTMWSTVVKRDFIICNKIKIVNPNWSSILEHSFLEDLFFFMQVISNVKMEKCLLILDKIYFYNKNTKSMTNTKMPRIHRTYIRMRNIVDGYNVKKTVLTKKQIQNIFFGRKVFCWSERLLRNNFMFTSLYNEYMQLNIPKIWYKIFSVEFVYKVLKWIKIKMTIFKK